jgi:hypothetical protein
MARDQGIGEINEDAIEIVGERLDSVRMEWIQATPASPTDLSTGPYYHPHSVAV